MSYYEDEHWQVLNGGKTIVSNTAQELWNNAIEYFKWCKDYPIKYKRVLTSGRDAGTKIEMEATRPYTVRGLCLHCGITEEYLLELMMVKDRSSLFYIVSSRIRDIIYTQNVEHAMVDVFNPIFTSKVLNMEKEETPSGAIKVEVMHGLPALSTSENEILEKLDLEIQEKENGETENP